MANNKKRKNRTKENVESVKQSAFAKINKRILLKLLINFTIVFGFYRVLIELGDRYQKPLILELAVYGYIAITTILAIVFIYFNRGLSSDIPTKEQLNDSLTDEEKEKFISDLIESRKKGKKVLMILIPFIFTLLLDAILLIFFSQWA